jgi:hypothetical protein
MEIGFTNLQQPLGFRTGFVAAEIWPVASHATNEGFEGLHSDVAFYALGKIVRVNRLIRLSTATE